MSRKLGAIALVLAVLVCSMELKSALTSGQQQHNGGTVLMANGPDPAPTGPPPGKKSGYHSGATVLANGPDPAPTGPPPGKKSGN